MTVSVPTAVKFDLFGEVVPLQLAAGASGWTPTRPLGGWIATYGQLADDGSVIETRDREGHVFEAAKYAPEMGRIDWSDYLRKGKWNDTHDPIYVGLPRVLEFHDATSPLAKAHRKVGFWTEGHLFDRSDPRSWTLFSDYEPTEQDLARSDYYWSLSTMLKGLPRPLGFSAHGKMLLSPCGNRIIWARVEENAVCEVPQNPDAIAQPLRLAVPIRSGMVGRSPCANCRCPATARCKVLVKGDPTAGGAIHGGELPAPDAVINAANLVGQAIPPEATAEYVVTRIMQSMGCSRETAERWIAEFVTRNQRARPAQQERQG